MDGDLASRKLNNIMIKSPGVLGSMLKDRKHPQLCRLARLLLRVPASSIAQETHFSEVKRRFSGMQSYMVVHNLDRDGDVFAWAGTSRQ